MSHVQSDITRPRTIGMSYWLQKLIRLKMNLPFAGEFQRAYFDAAAVVGGPRVPRAAGQGLQVPELAGADVLRGRLLCVLLLDHCLPHRQTLQPPAGRDVRAGPPERERLPLSMRAGGRERNTESRRSAKGKRNWTKCGRQEGWFKDFDQLSILTAFCFPSSSNELKVAHVKGNFTRHINRITRLDLNDCSWSCEYYYVLDETNSIFWGWKICREVVVTKKH